MSTETDTKAVADGAAQDGHGTLSVTDNRTGRSYEIEISDGTVRSTDFRQIKVSDDDFGLMTYDPAYMNTASCRSEITFLDGEAGVLEYRGYPIEQLAEKSTYLEVAYLLVHGDLPTAQQLEEWIGEITIHTFVHENVKGFMQGFRHDAHPMGMLLGSVGALSTFYPDANDITDPENRHIQTIRLIAKMPTLAAFAYRHNMGQPYVYPDNDLAYSGNFLNMMYKMTELKYEPDPRLERALDILFILHADHEQNCSTSAVRSVGSSQVDPYSAVAAGVAALYGPLHGGANEAVLRMLDRIGTAENIPDFLEGVKKREERLMGFGHRVYRAEDPRARVLRRTCSELGSPRFEAAQALEKAALAELTARKPDRVLATNVEFWSAVILDLAEVPADLFTPMFTCARVAGWSAHILEQKREAKLIRPTAKYVGHGPRPVSDVE
jgi:citrate synthase